MTGPDQTRTTLAERLARSTSQLLKAASESLTRTCSKGPAKRSTLTGFSKTVEKDFRRRA
jgi:hypothetical protein